MPELLILACDDLELISLKNALKLHNISAKYFNGIDSLQQAVTECKKNFILLLESGNNEDISLFIKKICSLKKRNIYLFLITDNFYNRENFYYITPYVNIRVFTKPINYIEVIDEVLKKMSVQH